MSKDKSKYKHGGDLVATALHAHGVEYIFSLCGGHISPLLTGAEDVGIRIIDVRDEKNAAFAADSISRLTSTPGVVAITAGPGVTNTVTAIKNAQMAESPLIILGGATATMLEGRGALQDIDQLSLLESVTKWRTSVRKVKDIIPTIEEAFRISQSGVPGPVFVELPVDVLYPEEIVRDWYGKKSTKKTSLFGKLINWYTNRHLNKLFEGPIPDSSEIQPLEISFISNKQITNIVELIEDASKPVMVLSSQVMMVKSHTDELIEAIEDLQIPVFLSGMARGLLGKDHNLHIRHSRSKALREADLILLAGVPLDFRLDYGRVLNSRGTVVSVNRSKETLNMNKIFRGVDIKIQAEAGDAIIKIANQSMVNSNKWSSWHDKLMERQLSRDDQIRETASEDTEYINPLAINFAIDEIMEDESVIIADGGDFVATMSYIVQPRGALRWLDPGPFGTLGVGAGFAMGAKLTYPDSTIWLIYGDGAAGFSINEFNTFVRHDIPVIAIIGNDASWQQIAREQVEIFDTALATELDYTSYEKVAEGYGAKGILIESPDELKSNLKKAYEIVQSGTPVLVNVKIGKTDFRKGSISM